MIKHVSAFIVLLVAIAISPCPPTLAEQPSLRVSSHSENEPIVETHHEIKFGEKTLKYTAPAGRLPIRDNETGEIRGFMFFISYLLDRRPSDPIRPLTFLWNGGPGADSTLVHLSGFGPKWIKAKKNQNGSTGPECELQDNQETWLDHTDLVFVDPIGTGFSVPTKAEYGKEFYNTLGDIASVAEFVRVYLTRFDAWNAPLTIGGESYGVWRAAGVAEALIKRKHKVAGVILISGGIPVGQLISDELRTALFIPTRTAAAFHHKKLPSDLQTDLAATLTQSEAWARTVYAEALTKRDTLSDIERQNIIAQLARFTGLNASFIDPKTLIIGRQQFAEQLLGDQKLTLARYDTRQTTKTGFGYSTDHKLLINKYLRTTLQYKTDLAYRGVEEGFTPGTRTRIPSIAERWEYNQGPPQPTGTPPNSDAPPGGHQPWLRRAMEMDHTLKAFVAVGLYDSLNSCAAISTTVSKLDAGIAQNITVKCYDGGHMMYETPSARKQFKQDIDKFYQDLAIR